MSLVNTSINVSDQINIVRCVAYKVLLFVNGNNRPALSVAMTLWAKGQRETLYIALTRAGVSKNTNTFKKIKWKLTLHNVCGA